jgi:hypothetical protein
LLQVKRRGDVLRTLHSEQTHASLPFSVWNIGSLGKLIKSMGRGSGQPLEEEMLCWDEHGEREEEMKEDKNTERGGGTDGKYRAVGRRERGMDRKSVES